MERQNEQNVFVETEEEVLQKDKTRGKRRKTDYAKATRKMKISKEIDIDHRGFYGDELHRYSKNKIHCSCPMCQSKTNSRTSKSMGPVDTQTREVNGEKHQYARGSRIPTTNRRFGKKHYKVSDQKSVAMMMDKEQHWEEDSVSQDTWGK